MFHDEKSLFHIGQKSKVLITNKSKLLHYIVTNRVKRSDSQSGVVDASYLWELGGKTLHVEGDSVLEIPCSFFCEGCDDNRPRRNVIDNHQLETAKSH